MNGTPPSPAPPSGPHAGGTSVPPAPPSGVTFEAWWRPARIFAAVVLMAAGATASALGYTHTNDSKADKSMERADRAVGDAKAALDGVSQVRADMERQVRENQIALEKIREDMRTNRAEDREALVRLQEQIRSMGVQVQETRLDMRSLLDRLNVPARTRTARDYP